MGKQKEHPRYNVYPFRASDTEAMEIESNIPRGKRGEFFREAVLEKIRREKQRRIDHALSDRSL